MSGSDQWLPSAATTLHVRKIFYHPQPDQTRYNMTTNSIIGKEPTAAKLRTSNTSTQYFLREVVIDSVKKNSSTYLPWVRIAVFPTAFIIETINLRDLSRLVISPEKSNSFGIFGFQTQQ